MTTHEKFQLLAAAVLETVRRIRKVNYITSVDGLIDAVIKDWDGSFSREEVFGAIDLLRKCGLSETATTQPMPIVVKISYVGVIDQLKSGRGMKFNPRRVLPLLYEYAQSGSDWLNGMWLLHMVHSEDERISSNATETSIENDEQ